MRQQRREVEDIDNTNIITPSAKSKIKKERHSNYSVCHNSNNISNSSPVCLRMVLMFVILYVWVDMLDWGEAGPEERKKFKRDCAIATTIIVIGSIAAIML